MAERRSSRDLAAALINGLAPADDQNLDSTTRQQQDRSRSELNAFLDQLEQRSRYNLTHAHCTHPAATDFSLDGLSSFLQHDLTKKHQKEEELQNDLQRASLDAEKSRLRDLVNGPNQISVDVQDGRLFVAPSFTVGHVPPVPAQERSSVQVPQRAHGFSRTSFSKGKFRANKSPSALRSVSKKGPTQPSSSEPSAADFFSMLPDFAFLDSLPQHSWSTLPLQTPPETADDNDDEADEADFGVAMEDVDDSEASPNASSSANGMQGRPERNPSDLCDSTSSGPSSLTKPSGAIRESSKAKRVGSRTLSFEKYANVFRQSARNSIENVRNLVLIDDGENGREEPDITRPRKTASKSPITNADLTAPVFGSSLCTSPLSPSSDHGEVTAEFAQLVRGTGSPDTESLELLPSGRRSGKRRQSPSASASGKAVADEQLLSDVGDSADHLAAVFASREAPTGHDTFYSGSSDDGSSNEEDGHSQPAPAETSSRMKELVLQRSRRSGNDSAHNYAFDWQNVVPEQLPSDIRQARENCRRVWSITGLDEQGRLDSMNGDFRYNTQYSMEELSPFHENILGAPDKFGQYSREWRNHATNLPSIASYLPTTARELDELPLQILPVVCQYLSLRDVRNLRLVNRAMAEALLPLITRSVVTKFGRSMFEDCARGSWDSKRDSPSDDSMFHLCGDNINRFGISFEYDPVGLANAEPKEIEKEVSAWFGTYTWPTERYPRFPALKEVEDMVDNHRPLLKNTMKHLTKVSELGLSVDSGHGWLNGPDISDLALFAQRQAGGSKVFGKTFDAPDKWNDFALREYFKWGQMNSINAYTKHLEQSESPGIAMREQLNLLRRLQVRDYDSYKVQRLQPDFNRYAHTGGLTPMTPVQQQTLQQQIAGVPPPGWNAGLLNPGWNVLPINPGNNNIGQNNNLAFGPGAWITPNGPHMAPNFQQAQQNVVQNGRVRQNTQPGPSGSREQDQSRDEPVLPQWPLLFNCHNLAAQVGGNRPFVQEMVSHPAQFGFAPGDLSEAQAQWLMETLWAQRAFMSAYTNSIISNAGNFKHVHSLHIAKLSSGLILSIAQRDFWTSLPGLKNLTLRISPDWRQEHIPGDKFFARNMAISPLEASSKLAYLLENFIVQMENLSTLCVGFVGGGEHQTGMFARNCHVLPAPITHDPRAWLSNHERAPDPSTMLAFNHIRNLTFENCWFSPLMLETFMEKSRDTSLHHLTLDSVSLTGSHDLRADGPFTTGGNNLRCEFSPGEWLQEIVPVSARWVRVLDAITPGKTIQHRKYDADMIDEEQNPRPNPEFRGNIKAITLKSCGYVRIGGVRAEQFSQNGLVEHANPWLASDEGLEARRKFFYVSNRLETVTAPSGGSRRRSESARRRQSVDQSKEVVMQCIMMNTRDPESRNHWFGLGKLTQCVHPVEKRVLERAWGMRFGWGDTMDRWGAVEDGCYEGGTGRFSGTVE